MSKKIFDDSFYNDVINANEGVTKKDINKVFLWYDLLAYALPFQAILMLMYFTGIEKYLYTAFSVITVILMDSIIKNSLQRNGKNFSKFQENISLVKLWAIPLSIMGMVVIFSIIVTNFGLI